MEENIARLDKVRREERLQRERHTPDQRAAPAAVEDVRRGPGGGSRTDALVNGLVNRGFYCTIEGTYHPYSEQTKQRLEGHLNELRISLANADGTMRRAITAGIGDILGFQLQRDQSAECAERAAWRRVDVPAILYKYIPKGRIGEGAPDSLRATQLLSLNDDMECNVTTMKNEEQLDTLTFLALVQSKLEGHLGIAIPWEELLTRSIRYGDLRLSTFIQEYLNPRVGVVSFTADLLVPTMWAHYARNTGIVVGYDTEALRALGFELMPVVYSELAPVYEPRKDDVIRLSFVDRDRVEQRARSGETSEGWPVMADANLAEMGAGWKSLSRLLFVKGISWMYEKEVRLLVDLEQTQDTGKIDSNGRPIKVISPPPEAIREIYGGANTSEADLARAAEVARGEDKRGLFVGQVTSHAFRMQSTGGSRY